MLAEVVNDDGTMARLPQLEAFAEPSTACSSSRSRISSATAVTARSSCGGSARRASRPRHGDFTAYVFESLLDGVEHMAFVCGEVAGAGERAGPGAQRVPDRRRVRLDALRLRPPARRGAGADRGRGPRRRRVPARPRGPRHRARVTSCGRTRCRTRVATPSRRTRSSGSRPTRASTASARRSSSTSGSPPCG